MAKYQWPNELFQWPTINLGTILGCGSINELKKTANQQQETQQNLQTYRDKDTSRLLQILISESAHLIWVLRCERVIQGKRHPTREIKARWLLVRIIDTRLTNNKITATKVKQKGRFHHLVENTWEQVLTKGGDIPKDWIYSSEVLVGRRLPPPF